MGLGGSYRRFVHTHSNRLGQDTVFSAILVVVEESNIQPVVRMYTYDPEILVEQKSHSPY